MRRRVPSALPTIHRRARMILNHICENCGKPLRLGLAVTTSLAVLLLVRCKAQSSGGGDDSAAARTETATELLQI
jgi:hypothetical protein